MQNAKQKVEDSKANRIKELKEKIHDPEYINYAVDRIAVVMSKRIVGLNSPHGSADYGI